MPLAQKRNDGIFRLACEGDIDFKLRNRSHACSHVPPSFEGLAAKLTEHVAGEQMVNYDPVENIRSNPPVLSARYCAKSAE